jgi:hypothetical protein
MKNILKILITTMVSITLYSCAGKTSSFDVNGVWDLPSPDDYFISAVAITDGLQIFIEGANDEEISTYVMPTDIEKYDDYFTLAFENGEPIKFNIINNNTIQVFGSETEVTRLEVESILGTEIDRNFLAGTWVGKLDSVTFDGDKYFHEDFEVIHDGGKVINNDSGTLYDFFVFDINEEPYILFYETGNYVYDAAVILKFKDRDNFSLLIASHEPLYYTRSK